MPKSVSSSSPVKTRQTNKSPTKSPRKKKQAPDHEQDRSQWRPSEIPETATISKTIALKTYHLGQESLKGLSYETSQTVRKIPGYGDAPVPMHLYKEREVEMKAWEKHGGPGAFEKMLHEKEKGYYQKHSIKLGHVFPRPRYYPSKVETPPTVLKYHPTTLNMPDRETSTPGLLTMRDLLVGRGQRWLWDAINKVIHDEWELKYGEFAFLSGASEPSGAKRESIVKSAIDQTSGQYPRRPTATSCPSYSPLFRAFLDILSRAPAFDPGRYDNPGIIIDEDGFTGDRSIYWSQSYTDEVYAGLIQVIKEHGLDGWTHARWLVYDKYVECHIGGLAYWEDDRGPGWIWNDDARFWLHGKTIDSDFPEGCRQRPSEKYVEYRSQLQKIGAIKIQGNLITLLAT